MLQQQLRQLLGKHCMLAMKNCASMCALDMVARDKPTLHCSLEALCVAPWLCKFNLLGTMWAVDAMMEGAAKTQVVCCNMQL